MKIERLPNNPLLDVDHNPNLEGNINGPSVIKVPDWLPNPLGAYYMYFAHHNGTYIRLAYADSVEGPWTVYEPGTLKLENAYTDLHVASPDVHVDDDAQEIRMYYHGPILSEGGQRTKLATSKDGIDFTARPESLGEPYFRVFQWAGYWYAIGMPGILYRSKDGVTDFERGPTLFPNNMRHSALRLDGNMLSVFYTFAFTNSESIVLSQIDLSPDWQDWKPTDPITMLSPELDYEGIDMPEEPSKRGAIMERVRQLRDPAIYRENDDTYLLYSIAGEQGIAIARVLD